MILDKMRKYKPGKGYYKIRKKDNINVCIHWEDIRIVLKLWDDNNEDYTMAINIYYNGDIGLNYWKYGTANRNGLCRYSPEEDKKIWENEKMIRKICSEN